MLFPGDALLDQLREDKDTAESQVGAWLLSIRIIPIIGWVFCCFTAVHTFSVKLLPYPAPQDVWFDNN